MAAYTFNRTLNTRPGKRERIAVSTVVQKLTPASYTIAGSDGNWDTLRRPDSLASGAIIQVLTNSMYYTLEGTDPTAAIGFAVVAGDLITLDSRQQLKDFKIIRQSADGAIEVLYLWGS